MKFHSRVVHCRGPFSHRSADTLELALTDRQVIVLLHLTLSMSVGGSCWHQSRSADRCDVGRGRWIDREDWVRCVCAFGVERSWCTCVLCGHNDTRALSADG